MINTFSNLTANLAGFLGKWRIVRFIITGGISFSVNLILLYSLTEFLGLWYIFSATLSFVVAFIIGFMMNKFWTFTNISETGIRAQIFVYLFINLFNLALNNTILYFLVESWGLWYVLAQVIASALIAFESFFAYKRLFKNA